MLSVSSRYREPMSVSLLGAGDADAVENTNIGDH